MRVEARGGMVYPPVGPSASPQQGIGVQARSVDTARASSRAAHGTPPDDPGYARSGHNSEALPLRRPVMDDELGELHTQKPEPPEPRECDTCGGQMIAGRGNTYTCPTCKVHVVVCRVT